MKLRIVSDLHFEFQQDAGIELIHHIADEPFDVLVIAGDLTNAAGLGAALRLVTDVVHRPIVYVHGNHEFYGSNRAAVLKTTTEAAAERSNLHFLDCDTVTIDGVRFVGTPLWFAKSDAPTWAMTDFTVIDRYRDWVYDENQRAALYLYRNVIAGDVVVTHHLPSEQSVHPKFKGSPLNPFFVCDVEPMIRREKPGLVVHGHTHCSTDYALGETRIICNPYGYAGYETNPDFDPALTVELT